MPGPSDIESFLHETNVERQFWDNFVYLLGIIGILYLLVSLFPLFGGPIWILVGLNLFLILSNWILPVFSRWRYRGRTLKRMQEYCEENGITDRNLAEGINSSPRVYPTLASLQDPLLDEIESFLTKMDDQLGKIHLHFQIVLLTLSTGVAFTVLHSTVPYQFWKDWALCAGALLCVPLGILLLGRLPSKLIARRYSNSVEPDLCRYCEKRRETLRGLRSLVRSRSPQYRHLSRYITTTPRSRPLR